LDAEPRITSVAGFPSLHDFEPYAYVVDIGGGRLDLHLSGHVVRDPTAKEWSHDLVFVEARFNLVRCYRFDDTLFGKQNVLFGMTIFSVEEAQRQQVIGEAADDWLETTRVFALESTIGLSGYVAADSVEFVERSKRWSAS
jgi:hypothetical protein